MTTQQRFSMNERLEHELAMERRAAMRLVLSAPKTVVGDDADDVIVPLCIYCGCRPAEEGSDYCGVICAIDAAREEN